MLKQLLLFITIISVADASSGNPGDDLLRPFQNGQFVPYQQRLKNFSKYWLETHPQPQPQPQPEPQSEPRVFMSTVEQTITTTVLVPHSVLSHPDHEPPLQRIRDEFRRHIHSTAQAATAPTFGVSGNLVPRSSAQPENPFAVSQAPDRRPLPQIPQATPSNPISSAQPPMPDQQSFLSSSFAPTAALQRSISPFAISAPSTISSSTGGTVPPIKPDVLYRPPAWLLERYPQGPTSTQSINPGDSRLTTWSPISLSSATQTEREQYRHCAAHPVMHRVVMPDPYLPLPVSHIQPQTGIPSLLSVGLSGSATGDSTAHLDLGRTMSAFESQPANPFPVFPSAQNSQQGIAQPPSIAQQGFSANHFGTTAMPQQPAIPVAPRVPPYAPAASMSEPSIQFSHDGAPVPFIPKYITVPQHWFSLVLCNAFDPISMFPGDNFATIQGGRGIPTPWPDFKVRVSIVDEFVSGEKKRRLIEFRQVVDRYDPMLGRRGRGKKIDVVIATKQMTSEELCALAESKGVHYSRSTMASLLDSGDLGNLCHEMYLKTFFPQS